MTNDDPNAADLLARLTRDGIEHFWVTYYDYSGLGCSKSVPPEVFRGTVESGVVFTPANLDMDILDRQPPTATWLANSGDFLALPDPASYTVLPRFPRTAKANVWMRATDGGLWQGCPRTRLQAVVDDLASEGFAASCALEPEFYLLNKVGESEYEPVNATRMFTQAGLQQAQPFATRVVDELRAMDVPVDQLGKEYGQGQYEMSVYHGTPLEAIDRYWSLKDAVTDIARECGYIATFMPKVYANWAGNSLHVHMSLSDLEGKGNVMESADDETSLSQTGLWFLGGLLTHAPALTGLGSPTVNSYKRLLPGSWAPANVYWGYGNRSGVARVPGVGSRRHIEYRSGDNSCQPALFLAGLLAAGLDGIRRQIDPGPPYQGDVGRLTVDEMAELGLTFLPRTLRDALDALESDEVVAAAVGDEILPHLLSIKRSEMEAYELTVHPWERTTYLEVI
ncbi:MAG: glutamine synthetase [Thermomicrobiales bacterium]|nr:glutamine synthetase [Thermomicrobiales bacterium]